MLASRNYPPSDALRPFVRRHYVFEAPLPPGHVLEDFVLAETAFVRLLTRGNWSAETEPGTWSTAGQTVFFGANQKPLHVRVEGGFGVAGFAIRPSGWRSFFKQPHSDYCDAMLPLPEVWGESADGLLEGVLSANDDSEIVATMERAIMARLDEIGRFKPDALMAQFEIIARTDSMRRVEDIADEFGLSVRQLERRCLESFGLTPKAILRRSRFLDMAAAMRGFSSPDEKFLAELRYFDQSHLNREFKRFAGMTPGRFAKSVTPLQTAGLKLREEGKHLE
jgi:AraC-like DNA-binding protein